MKKLFPILDARYSFIPYSMKRRKGKTKSLNNQTKKQNNFIFCIFYFFLYSYFYLCDHPAFYSRLAFYQ